MKKNLLIIIIVFITLAGILGASGNFSIGRDKLIEEFPNGIQGSVDIPSGTIIPSTYKSGPIEIVAEEERTEEAMIFYVYSGGIVIGEFAYARTQELRPLYEEFNGDYILGKSLLLRAASGKIKPLNSIESEWIMDYSINGNLLATVEKVRGKEHHFEVVIKDVEADKIQVIHRFKYGNYLYPPFVSLDWGYDGKLYYDSFNGDVPVVNVYDPKTDSSKELFTSAYAPQTSKDRTKILYYQLDEDLDFRTGNMILYDLADKKIVKPVQGVYKTFWIKDYLITKDADNIYIYLADSGELVQEIKTAVDPFDAQIIDGKLVLDSYYFDSSVKGTLITKKQTASYDIHKK